MNSNPVNRLLKRTGLFDPARRLKQLFWTKAARQSWERAIRFYSEFIEDGSLCFDIGAHTGSRTDVFWQLGARVVAVEPQPLCLEKLRVLHDHHAGVAIVPVAIASEDGEGHILVSDRMPYVSTMSDEWRNAVVQSGRWAKGDWNQEIKVQTTTLDKLICEHGLPDFCKIDIEGYELQALRGLSQRIPLLSFEFTGEYLDVAEACVRRCVELGYAEFNFSLEESFALDHWNTAAQMLTRLQLSLREADRPISGDIYAR